MVTPADALRGREDVERNDFIVCDDARWSSGIFHGSSLLVDLLACDIGDGYRGRIQLVHDAQGRDHSKMQKVGDLNM